MVICRTPVRISFFGGGTDYPEWYLHNGGQVLSTTINKYTYANCRYLRPYFTKKYRFTYSKIENVNSIDEIEHPLIKGCIKFLNIKQGLEIHYDAELPARSGLGTSSSFTVGLLNSLCTLKGVTIDKSTLVKNSIHIERELLNETGGIQDQISAVYGGINHIFFNKSGKYKVTEIKIPEKTKKDLNSHLMLFYTGIQRISSDIANQQLKRIRQNKKTLQHIFDLVDKAKAALLKNSILDFGQLLHETWVYKKSLSKNISDNFIDEIYQKSLTAGAIGGKLCGAGAGGFLLIFAEPEKQEAIRHSLNHLIHVPFKFENDGSKIIFNNEI